MKTFIMALSVIVFGLAVTPSVEAARLDGVYAGDARAQIVGQTVSVPFAFTVRGQRLDGRILVPGVGQLVQIRGAVNQGNGRFTGLVSLQFGITGQFVGTINRDRRLTGNGTLNVPGFGPVTFRLKAEAGERRSPFQGTWVAERQAGQQGSINRVEVLVTREGVATLYFETNAGQTIRNNQIVSDDGQLNSVIDIQTNQPDAFRYFVTLGRNGTFNVNYQGGLGRGELDGRRTTKGGVRRSLRGTYVARRTIAAEPITRVEFTVQRDRSLSGSFRLPSGQSIPFTNIVGDQNDFAGNTETGIAYFAQIGADGSFVLDYQLRTLQRGTLTGSVR